MEEIKNKVKNIRQRSPIMRMLPNVITISSFCFGLTSVRFALFHKWELAVMCILISAILDSFDGRVARMLGHSSQFGAELDSLSDLVCFGVAPGLVLFMKVMYFVDGLGWGICTFFTICCALRLARFNTVQIMSERDSEQKQPDWIKKYFTGVPAPAGAVLALFPMILHFATGNFVFLNTFFVSVCILFSGIMMISRVKSFSSKMIEFKEGFASPELIIMTLIIICLINSPWVTLSVLTVVYVAMIPYGAYCYRRQRMSEQSSVEQHQDSTSKTGTQNI